MNAELDTSTPESTVDPATADATTTTATDRETETFPYAPGERGAALPGPTARGRLGSNDADGSAGAAGSTACPDCGEATVNGAGLFACAECDWTGALR